MARRGLFSDAGSFGGGRKLVDGEMDITPMIDVTFLLLIFFICTASFALQMTKPIPAPKEDDPSTNAQTIEEEQEDDAITVRIDANNTFLVNEEEAPRAFRVCSSESRKKLAYLK